MKKRQFKKRFMTLVEMMIVMFLIAMITGVIAYNYTGSLDEGKAFKTQAGMEKIRTVLDLYAASHPNEDNIEGQWQTIVANSPLVKNAAELTKDGWGGEYQVSRKDGGEFEVTSAKMQAYHGKGKNSMFKNPNDQSQ
jgi:general secretion pathway protein G